MSYSIDIRGQVAKKAELKLYAHAVLGHFFKNRLKRNITINIKMVRELTDEDGKPCGGLCWGNRNTVNIEIGRGTKRKQPDGSRVYKKYTHGEIVELFTHELVHAKQFIRGEINCRNMMWRGEDGPVDCEGVRYRSQPWEKEAYRYEKLLKKIYWD
jgi:hypothetical protein